LAQAVLTQGPPPQTLCRGCCGSGLAPMGCSLSSCCPSSETEAQTTKVFWSGHLTQGHEERRLQWLSPIREADAEIKFSYPPFNNKVGLDFPASVEKINVPCFGPNIINAVMAIFESDEMKDIASRLGLIIPRYALDKMIQEKIPRVRDMIKYCDQTPEIVGSNAAAIRQLEKFVGEFEAISEASIKGLSDWEAFVGKHAEPGWQDKLHFDHLLSNFGFTDEASKALQKVDFTKPDGEVVNFEQHAFRWLSKALSGYKPPGALTDVANFVFALTGDSYEGLDDLQIADKMRALLAKVKEGSFAKLWIPTYLFMDAETDDGLVWVLAEYLCKRTSKNLRVLIQLPPDTEFDELAAKWIKVPGCEVWRDPDSRNAQALEKYLLPSEIRSGSLFA